MFESYASARSPVRRLVAGAAGLVCLALAAEVAAAGRVQQPADGAVRLQVRIFDGTLDVTRESRLLLYPRGNRSTAIPVTLGPDHAHEAVVEPGFYDLQAIREQEGQVSGIRWVEQVLVQRYPDEYGRHLQVLNFKPGYGALQIRPSQDAPNIRGWSAAAFTLTEPAREVAPARAIGRDLLVIVPAGRYDVKIALPDQRTSWLRGIEIPADRTRLKTWTPPQN